MSDATINVNTANFLSVNRDTAKVILGKNTFVSGDIDNTTGSELTLPAGTLIGRISATEKLAVLKSAAADGSQFPVGVMTEEVVIPIAGAANISIAVSGMVNENGLVLDGADALATVISGRTIRDRIGADTVGIELLASTQLSGFDN